MKFFENLESMIFFEDGVPQSPDLPEKELF